jgi:hypothetical protein
MKLTSWRCCWPKTTRGNGKKHEMEKEENARNVVHCSCFLLSLKKCLVSWRVFYSNFTVFHSVQKYYFYLKKMSKKKYV